MRRNSEIEASKNSLRVRSRLQLARAGRADQIESRRLPPDRREEGTGRSVFLARDDVGRIHPSVIPRGCRSVVASRTKNIADWYNPIIQHGEVDFRDPRRDHTHGRIGRVTAKNRPLVPRPKLVGATVPELLEQLKAPDQWTRHNAKRVLPSPRRIQTTQPRVTSEVRAPMTRIVRIDERVRHRLATPTSTAIILSDDFDHC